MHFNQLLGIRIVSASILRTSLVSLNHPDSVPQKKRNESPHNTLSLLGFSASVFFRPLSELAQKVISCDCNF